MKTKQITCIGLCASLLAGCSTGGSSVSDDTVSESAIVTNLDLIDNTQWQYNEEDNVYYQIGISYC